MLETLKESVRLAQSSWTGCCWETAHGPRALNLRGIQARQAVLAAKATRGEESRCWNEAAQWLAVVENDAKIAAERAGQALLAAESGDFYTALERFNEAVALAEKYSVAPQYIACRCLCQSFLCSDPAVT